MSMTLYTKPKTAISFIEPTITGLPSALIPLIMPQEPLWVTPLTACQIFQLKRSAQTFRVRCFPKTLDQSVTKDTIDFYTLADGSVSAALTTSNGVTETSHDSIFFTEYLDVKDKYSAYTGQNAAVVKATSTHAGNDTNAKADNNTDTNTDNDTDTNVAANNNSTETGKSILIIKRQLRQFHGTVFCKQL